VGHPDQEDELVERWEEAREAAMAGFREAGPGHLNCAQAVVRFAASALGFDPAAVVAARYMGGGSVGMGETCGAVEGAVVSMGLRDYFALDRHPDVLPVEKEALQDFIREFERQFGSVTCRGLTGYDISSPEGYDRFKQDVVSHRCDDYVAWVVDHLRPLLEG
jgi:C_GCAxxG_C_C family probable redox protein